MKKSNPSAADLAMPDEQATKLLMKLLAIQGPSGGETRVVKFIRQQLHKAGVPVSALKNDKAHRRSALGGEVGNLILRIPGTVRAPRRMLSAHLDTVPICVGTKPKRHGDRIDSVDPQTGLGGDNRAGVAVLLSTARSPYTPLGVMISSRGSVMKD